MYINKENLIFSIIIIIQDLILLHNLSGWFLTVGRLSGRMEYVMDPTVRLEFLQTREEPGKSEETEVLSPCNTELYYPEHLDCQWADWTESDCSASCGGGTLTRRRTVARSATGLGLNCTGKATELEGCNQHICPSVWTAVLVSLLLLLLACLSLIYCRRKYTVNHTPVSFNMPIIKVRK